MMKSRTQRKVFMVVVLAGIALAGFLTYRALQSNMLYFFSPTQVAAGEAPNRTFRLGGMVLAGSLKREPGTLNVSFVVTDNVHSVPVKYDQVLPDLFREGAGAVVIGRLNERGEFVGEQVLAKHDENYMPPEVADALEKARAAQRQ
ncbi:MAG TPA: cytochrome c maturation protein CcmE [Gammaproteobacteria bacterium]|nr:cytochrome c maturation protein CcmE [Gammaproteobacteria bacterium]